MDRKFQGNFCQSLRKDLAWRCPERYQNLAPLIFSLCAKLCYPEVRSQIDLPIKLSVRKWVCVQHISLTKTHVLNLWCDVLPSEGARSVLKCVGWSSFYERVNRFLCSRRLMINTSACTMRHKAEWFPRVYNKVKSSKHPAATTANTKIHRILSNMKHPSLK